MTGQRSFRTLESRKRVREANGSSVDMDPMAREEMDTIDVDMDTYDEEVPATELASMRALQVRTLAHTPYYAHIGGDDFSEDFPVISAHISHSLPTSVPIASSTTQNKS